MGDHYTATQSHQVNLHGNRVLAYDFLGLPIYREGRKLATFNPDDST